MNSSTSGIRTRQARLAVALTAVALVISPLVLASTAATAATDPCAVGGSAIVCENSKPGAAPSEWDIEGAGDNGIQGFATDMSVNVGSRIDFKIDTTATAYTIDIYRTGWYGGLGARKITSVPVTATLPQRQPVCLSDVLTELYDCGNWGVSASWNVPSTAVSGVYIARLHRNDTDDESHITFVVRNDASHSAVIFQTSDTTWHAYNGYGGADFYKGAANGRAYKVSYNRPFATREGLEARDFYFSAEYAMVRFLERNGYDLSYQSGVDTDRFGSLLTNHKVFLSVGHDEYWSGAQRANVEAARAAGVNLAFFSGNEVYWRTRYEGAKAGAATPYRTLVTYKETWEKAKTDPSPEWTGTWRDPRFASAANGGGKPENGLTGTMYAVQGNDLPVTVSSNEGKYRLWRGTSLTALPAGTSAALAPHTVGYESNEDFTNAARPAGLIQLSTTTGPAFERLLDYGNTVEQNSSTTHHVTLYRAPSGALVFSAGSVQWAWGLDATHDGDGAPADPRMQQATVNLLADMSAQPATLQAGLVTATKSTDTQAPTVTVTSPAAGMAVANGAAVTVSGTASDVGGGRVAGVEVSTDGGARWRPATGTTAWSYTYVQTGQGTVPIRVRAVDDSANLGTVPAAVALTVACPCSVFGSTTPATPATTDTSAVELGLRFTTTTDGFATGVRFYKGTGNAGTHTGSLWSDTGTRLAMVTFTGESATGWQTANFSGPVALSVGTPYVVSYTAPLGHYAAEFGVFYEQGIEAVPLRVAGGFGVAPAGVYGQPGSYPVSSFASAQYFVDVQFSTVDETPLTVTGSTPMVGASSVPTGSPVSVTLSKPVVASSVTLSVVSASGASVAGTTTYNAAIRTATFTPSSPLAASTAYTVTVGALDSRGTPITAGGTWSFTTAAPDQVLGVCPCTLYNDSSGPDVLDIPDLNSVTVGVRFASNVNGAVSAVRFYKGPNNIGAHVGTLWTAAGTVLAQGAFTGESATGWQTLTFAQPVQLTKDAEYVASYRTSVGRYSASPGALGALNTTRSPLRSMNDGGVYSYADSFPSNRTSTSYLVDVVFTKSAEPLAVVAQTPAPAEPGAALGSSVSLTVNVPLAGGPTLAVTAGGTPVAGTTTLSTDRKTLTFQPAVQLATSTIYTATAAGLVSTAGASLPPATWTFTSVGADGCPCTLFGTQTPAEASIADGGFVELGVAFTPSAEGQATGVRFYKGQGNSGTHSGSLWDANGTQLATVTFAGESTSGWQTATFGAPVQLQPGSTYVVSYLAPQGHYSATAGYFSSPRTAGPLTAPAAGNGRYRYGGGFPTSTWGATNYFVDVVFKLTPPTPPIVTSTSPPSGATGVARNGTVAATLSKAPAAGLPVLGLTSPAGALAGSSSYDTATRRVTFTPAAPLSAGTVISAAVTLGGVALGGGSWSFTTVTVNPSAVSLWTDAEVPTYQAIGNGNAVQVGTRFTPSTAGTITAIRFFKGPDNTGAHVVNLWGATGSLLASATSTSESASGWQTVPLSAPVQVTAGTLYTAAYYSASGLYAATIDELAAPRTRGPLSTPAMGGAYVYGTGFPGSGSYAGYGVDLLFVPSE